MPTITIIVSLMQPPSSSEAEGWREWVCVCVWVGVRTTNKHQHFVREFLLQFFLFSSLFLLFLGLLSFLISTHKHTDNSIFIFPHCEAHSASENAFLLEFFLSPKLEAECFSRNFLADALVDMWNIVFGFNVTFFLFSFLACAVSQAFLCGKKWWNVWIFHTYCSLCVNARISISSRIKHYHILSHSDFSGNMGVVVFLPNLLILLRLEIFSRFQLLNFRLPLSTHESAQIFTSFVSSPLFGCHDENDFSDFSLEHPTKNWNSPSSCSREISPSWDAHMMQFSIEKSVESARGEMSGAREGEKSSSRSTTAQLCEFSQFSPVSPLRRCVLCLWANNKQKLYVAFFSGERV